MIKGVLVRIRNVKAADLDEFYSLSSNYEDPGDFMPLSFVSELLLRQNLRIQVSGRIIVESCSLRILSVKLLERLASSKLHTILMAGKYTTEFSVVIEAKDSRVRP